MRKTLAMWLVALSALFAACQSSPNSASQPASTTSAMTEPTGEPESEPIEKGAQFGVAIPAGPTTAEGHAVATFAGGCFWCMEPPFDKLDGVLSTTSGYTDGKEPNPQYREVGSGKTGHTEAVLVIYDPARVTYDQLLTAFWRSHDPTDASGQFADRGSQYRPALYYHSEEQKQAAEKSREELANSGKFDKPIIVPIEAASDFWPAEEYHQDYYMKNPSHYKRYQRGSGRAGFLSKHWGKD